MISKDLKQKLRTLVPTNDQGEQKINESLSAKLEKFWKLDSIGIHPIDSVQDQDLTPNELLAIDILEKNSYYDSNLKRWFTVLLWDPGKEKKLGPNYNKSLSLMYSVEKSVANKGFLKEVNQTYDQFITDGFAEKVPNNEIYNPGSDIKCHFLPSFAVYALDRVSSRIRVVLHASSKSETSESLNSCLLPGPKQLPDLVKLLLQFRTKPVVLLADLKNQFLNFYLHKKEDQDCQRYLWRHGNKTDIPTQYRFKCLIFGSLASPFSACYLTKKHSEMFKRQYPLANLAISQSCYMDDALTTWDTIEQGRTCANELIQLFALCSIKVHKLSSNFPEVLEGIDPSHVNPSENIKVLGYPYDIKTDEIILNFTSLNKPNTTDKLTKRKLLAEISELYDPNGYISTLILTAKLLMQQVWLSGTKWDDLVSTDIQSTWNELKTQLIKLNGLRIPRQMSPNEMKATSHSLITFCDASLKSYAAVCYLLTTYVDGSKTCNFVISKTRVAPLKVLQSTKQPTLPRLELLACSIGSRLAAYVKNSLAPKIKIDSWTFLSDSAINLLRIKQSNWSKYKQWVSNRLKEILEITDAKTWLHVPSELNPADLATRPSTVDDFLKDKAWFHGPEFLMLNESDWPSISHINTNNKATSTLADDELLPQTEKTLTVRPTNSFFITLFSRYSNWNKTVRFFSVILRFCSKKHRPYANKAFTVEELSATENFLLAHCQSDAFADELKKIRSHRPVDKKSSLASLNPFLNDLGLLCSNTRLTLSDTLSLEERYPIILPKSNPIVEKLILHLHDEHKHVGITYMLNIVRSKYYLIGSRRELKRVLRLCPNLRCKRLIHPKQLMAPLPRERTSIGNCFSVVAIDYFGPLYHFEYVDNKLISRKIWVCVYVCMVSRAVHLEIILDATTEEFLNCLRLMIARRGLLSKIFSDNMTTFKKADKELQVLLSKIDWNKVNSFYLSKKIVWTYTDPYSPWQNPAAEASVRSIKLIAKKIINQAKLSLRNLQVIIAECELMVNCRPLTPCDDMVGLTPGELLYGKRLFGLPDPPNFENLNFEQFWRKKKQLMSAIWKRFSTTYLYSLSIRKKWKFPVAANLINQLVLVNDKNLIKNSWKIARIIDVVYSKADGLIRTVKLKTPTGEIFRSINSLSFFESDFDVSEK
jgi:hypothetical protein